MTDLRAHDGEGVADGASGASADSDHAARPDGTGPLRPGAEPTTTLTPAAPNVTGTPTAVEHDGPLAGLTILVVDDDLGICQSMAELLRSHGSEVAFATCAAEALELIATRRFDLVVLDIMMPDMDGLVVLDAIRRTSGDLPVILITGLVVDSLARKVAHHKAVSFFEKGSGLDRFVELVNETLGRKAEA
jgi:CheY-like chemotaxis protein